MMLIAHAQNWIDGTSAQLAIADALVTARCTSILDAETLAERLDSGHFRGYAICVEVWLEARGSFRRYVTRAIR